MMVRVVFEYKDRYTNGEWRKQECITTSVEEAIKFYGLGVDCEYRILIVEKTSRVSQMSQKAVL